MHEKVKDLRVELIRTFNINPKAAIDLIKKTCKENSIENPAQQIGAFFLAEAKDLDLSAVGNYLGTKVNKDVLDAFTKDMDFKDQEFIPALRNYLKFFKLPGEAQKIGRLLEKFGEIYSQQNRATEIANGDDSLVLGFAVMMLNTDLYNPAITNHMTLDEFRRNLRGMKDGGDFKPAFLETIYNEISSKKFEVNFTEVVPGIVFNDIMLRHDKFFKQINRLDAIENIDVDKIFKIDGRELKVKIDKPKPFLAFFTGYEGSITVTDKTTNSAVAINIYQPSLFLQIFSNEQPRVIVAPVAYKHTDLIDGQESIVGNAKDVLMLVGQISASFNTRYQSIESTYEYQKEDMKEAYNSAKSLEPQRNR